MKCDVYDVQQGDVAEYKADDIVGSPDCTAEAFDIPPRAEGVVSADEAFHIPPGPDAVKYKADATYGAPTPPLQPIQVAPPAAGALRTAPQCPTADEEVQFTLTGLFLPLTCLLTQFLVSCALYDVRRYLMRPLPAADIKLLADVRN